MKTPLFVTATDEAGGKTLVTLGLVSNLKGSHRLGFIKPVGLARVRAGADGIDIDAMLIDKTFHTRANIKDMCPVTLGRASWPEVSREDAERMMVRIRDSFARICADREIVVVEGSGHGALGSGLGLANGRIAAELGCKALLVSAYGTMAENPFDMAELNREYLQAKGVPVAGVIVNRVPADLVASFGEYARNQFQSLGMDLLGVIPEEPRLNSFHFLQVSEFLDGEMLCGEGSAERLIRRVRVGAMVPHRALQYFHPDSLIITPGDREDIIVTVCACAAARGGGPSGLVLYGGVRPDERILELLSGTGIPAFLATEDSYTVASRIHDMPLRIQPNDADKIALVEELVMQHVDLDRIVEAL